MARLTTTLVFSVLAGAGAAILAVGCSDETAVEMDTSDEYVTQVTTAEQFADKVLKADMPVLVDFYATWCGPCKLLAPRIHKLAREYRRRARFVKVDGDVSVDLRQRYKVRGYPTVIIFVGGKAGEPIVGLQGGDVYRAALEKAIATTEGKE